MTMIHLIRHGQHDQIGLVLAGRQPGITMNDQGRAEIDAIAHWLATRPLVALYASPVDRARESARIVAARTSLAPQHDERLTEIDFGLFADQALGSLVSDPEWLVWTTQRSLARFPNGETMLDVQARAVAFLLELRDRHAPGDEIAVISHAEPIRAALAYLLGTPIDLAERIEIGCGSVSSVLLTAEAVRVMRINQMVAAVA